MKKVSVGSGALIGGMLTAALMAIMYLGRGLFDLPFGPFDLFNWVARELPGDIITFGIDLMIDSFRLLGISVVDTAKTAEQIMAQGIFLGSGILAGLVYFAAMRARDEQPGRIGGLLMGLLYGIPHLLISLNITQSEAGTLAIILTMGLLFLAWGFSLNYSYERLASINAQAVQAISAPPAGTEFSDQLESGTEAELADSEPAKLAADEEEIREVERLNRRQFLVRLGASTATVTVLGGGIGAALAAAERRQLQTASTEVIAPLPTSTSTPTVQAVSGDAVAATPIPFIPVPGTRSEITPVEEHYKVFVRATPTIIEEEEWLLPITGLVDNPLMLTLDDFLDRWEARDQYVTLSCISGRIGTDLISTTRWTGVSVQDVLADAGLQENARYLIIRSGDGFYETVDLDLIAADERIMFAYAWDGKFIPKDHGFPLRIWIPDRYGMKQPKWITEIEVVADYQDGYWVERNWDKEALVRTTSVIDTVAVDDVFERSGQQLVPVGGIAFSGDKGISRVEVKVDDGEWQEARLKDPLSETTWVLWRFDWPFDSGNHTFKVRCYEGDGKLQITERNSNRPSGATGIHGVEARL